MLVSTAVGGSSTFARRDRRSDNFNARSGSILADVDEATAAVELRGVRKRFGDIVAVDGLDLEVRPGICLGLLGPNGAGKSTTMRMLTAQTLADEGSIRVLGFTLPEESSRPGWRWAWSPSWTTSTSS
jgi:ABC-type glutathione transport system ATPase component